MKLIHCLGATVISVTTLLASSLTSAAPSLFDGFESKNLSSPTGPSPALNTNGFRWGGTNYTSVVGMLNGQPTRVYAGSVINEVMAGYDFNCYSNTYCLRFRYPAGGDMAEQRFDLGTSYRDVWFRYWLRVPNNYTHGSRSPSNHKFFALWMDAYEGSSPLLIWEFWGTSNGSSTLGYHFRQTGGSDGPHLDQKPFISVPTDRGRWMQVVIHAKAATSNSSNDGVVELWRRWSNESAFTKLHEYNSANFTPVSNNGWRYGYFMGWTNAPYAQETEWLMDDLTVSNESLLTSTPATIQSPPTAPALSVQPR